MNINKSKRNVYNQNYAQDIQTITINDENDNVHEKKVNDRLDFQLNWNHIKSAIKQELSEETASMIINVINNDKYKEININSSPYFSAHVLLKIITDNKKFISKEEIQYIKRLILLSCCFRPEIMHKSIKNKDAEHSELPMESFEYGKNGLLSYLNSKYFDKADPPYRRTSSKLSKDSANLRYFTDTSSDWMVKTQITKESSFIAIHLNGIKMKLNQFALSAYSFNTKECDICFQASYDGNTWLNIKHFTENNQKLHCWLVNKDQRNSYFSDFRFFCKPQNKTGLCNLECCGLDMYGTAVMMNQDIFDVFRAYRFSNYHFKSIRVDKIYSPCKLTKPTFSS
eukprot:472907_1